MELAISACWTALVCWMILRALRQRDLLPAADVDPSVALQDFPRISVIVPARNEALNIAPCLNSLLDQTYPPDRLRLVMVDDGSTDDTFAIASHIAQRQPRLELIKSPPLRARWVGKCHACWTGAIAASPEDEWLCFVDADVVAGPDLLSTALTLAHSRPYDLLSLAPRQRLESFAERLIIPCGLFLMAFCQDLAAVQAQGSDQVTATGQFLLVRKWRYDAAGGHSAVYNRICEDVGLALLIKRAGGRVMLLDGKQLLSARMYTGWRDLWCGLSKNLVEMLGGAPATLIAAPLAVLLSWAVLVIPAMDAISCARGSSIGCVALLPSSLASAAVVGLHLAGAIYFRIPFWYGLLFPLAYSIGACLAIDSLRRRWCGSVVWKGRSYP